MPKISSVDQAATRIRTVLMGAPGVGKTFCAATLCEFWGKEKTLKDMYWISFDSNALAGFAEQGIVVPHVWDFTSVAPKDLGQEITKMIADIGKTVKEHGIKAVVVDTVTALDNLGRQYTEAHSIEGFERWTVVTGLHSRVYSAIRDLPVHGLFLGHYKQEQEGSEKTEASRLLMLRSQATAMDGGGALVLAVGTGPGKIYKTEMENFLVLCKVPIKPGAEERRLFAGRGEIEGKNRYRMDMEKGEEAHLGKLFAQFRANAMKGIGQ